MPVLVPPPPAVTSYSKASNIYWHAADWVRWAQPVLHPLANIIKQAAVAVQKGIADRVANTKASFRAALSRTWRSLKAALVRFLLALIKPVLAFAAFAGAITMIGPMLYKPTAALVPPPPAPAVRPPPAILKPARVPMPIRKVLPGTWTNSGNIDLIRFHKGSQTFATDAEAIDALADALNLPTATVNANVATFLHMANDNAIAMAKYAGHFPLPKTTPQRLLAALTPADIALLTRVYSHFQSFKAGHYTVTTELASGDLTLEGTVTVLQGSTGLRQCLETTFTYIRRTFRHTQTVAACRTGQVWAFTPSQ